MVGNKPEEEQSNFDEGNLSSGLKIKEKKGLRYKYFIELKGGNKNGI